MKSTQCVAVFLAVVLLCLCAPCVAGAAENCPTAFSINTPIVIKAHVYEHVGDVSRAQGDVGLFTSAGRMTADELSYDWAKSTAELRKAMFTTCLEAKPHYRIEADSITLLVPRRRIRARGVGVFLGNTRILALPSVKMRISQQGGAADLFPRVSYDKDGGYGLGKKIILVDNDRVFASADIHVSSKNGFEGDFESAVGFDGLLTPAYVQPLSFPSFRSMGLAIPVTPRPGAGPDDAEEERATRFRGFARYSAHLRTYNANNPDLLVYRQPEIGLQYLARPINLGNLCVDPKLPIAPLLSTSWGRFSEVQGAGPLNRSYFGGVVPVNVAAIGDSTVVQPTVEFNQFRYASGTTYTWSAYSLGVSHLANDGCLMALRYVNRNDRGFTPFQFDQLYVFDETQAAVQFTSRHYVTALVGGYDMQNKNLYDWSALLGYRTDCLAGAFAWSNLERKLTFNIQLLLR